MLAKLKGVFNLLKSIIYLILALATVFYALPKLNFTSGDLEVKLFSIFWIIFALLIIGAQLDYLLILDEDKRRRTLRRKKYLLWKREQRVLTANSNKLNAKSYNK